MKKKLKGIKLGKLQVNKETIIALTNPEELKDVAGGVSSSCAKSCGSCYPCIFA